MNSIVFGASHMLAAMVVCSALSMPASADSNHNHSSAGVAVSGDAHGHVRADGHAPIGVMGDHMHKAGEWMLSYRYMNMLMRGNRDRDSQISAETIATTIPNRFFGQPGQPATLRVVPTDMEMEMHMFGAMYAPTDWLTLMGMLNYVVKDMDHITFAGGAGAVELGTFNVKTKGLGDSRISGLVRVLESEAHNLHLNVGFSIPTGSITEEAQILAPNGARPVLRTPYAMQLGTGTVDFLPGITYTGQADAVAWGAQLNGEVRAYRNGEGYRHGNKARADVWGSYQWANWISTSLRLGAQWEGQISGIDDEIAVPNQTADPDNYGGRRIDLAVGFNLAGQRGRLRGARLGFEAVVPVYQHLNGPQLETDVILTLGLQYAF